MGLWENLFPRAAYRREAWRQGLENLRSYDAGTRSRLNANWAAINASAQVTDEPSRDILRARARDLERNSDVMQSILRAYRRNLIGKGYTLQAKTGRDEINAQIEQLWQRWTKARNCDVSGDQSLTEMLGMILDRKKVDGGVLIRKCYTGETIPMQLQIVEVDELDDLWTAPHYKGNRVVGGIEYDEYKRAVGYHLRRYDLDGWQLSEPEWVPAKNMIFLWSKHRPSQIREISDMAPIMTRIRDLNEFITAVSVKERITACLAVFIKKALPVGGFSGRNGQSAAKSAEYPRKTLAPGLIQELDAGDSVDVVNPAGTATDATTFLQIQQSLIGAGQGLSYETISRDLRKTNYSSARAGAIEDALTYQEDRVKLLELLDEIYESFVISVQLAGLIHAPDFWEHKEQYLTHTWATAPKAWVDPQKEANANRTAVQTLQKSFKDQCAEEGKDWRQQLDDTAEVLQYGAGLGLDLGGILFRQPTQDTLPEDEEAEEIAE